MLPRRWLKAHIYNSPDIIEVTVYFEVNKLLEIPDIYFELFPDPF